MHWMNREEKIKEMVEFIELKEKEAQSDKYAKDSQIKSDIVKSVLNKLEEMGIGHED